MKSKTFLKLAYCVGLNGWNRPLGKTLLIISLALLIVAAIPLSSTVKVWANGDYCSCGGTTYDEEWISRVKFSAIDNSSGGDGYSDYTSISTDVARGGTYTLKVTIGQIDSWPEYVKAYFDWNKDSDFLDAGEGIEIGHCSSDGCVVSANITIPDSAILGTTRMRIVQGYDSYHGPCGSYTYGDTEDYTINIQEGSPTPTPTPTYCSCGGTTYDEEWISRVKFNAIDKSSYGNGYSDYTSISTDVARGGTYTLKVTIGQIDSWPEYVKAYFDWNKDSDFLDAGEGIEIGHCSSDGCVVSESITIPVSAILGTTRMRIVQGYDSYHGPCGSYTYGDTEDYTINIQEGEVPPVINPPTVTNKDATNVTSNSATLSGEVTSTGGKNPTVYIYWGKNDGGTDPANWDHQENLGIKETGTFHKDISELNPNTTYYYRCYAENSAGSDWADETYQFTTK